jgi:hypothetical protein
VSPAAQPFALDHVVVAAATLADGVAWCEAAIGVAPQAGGEHPLMGTHNRIFKVATARYPKAYFEIIAIDPAAPRPSRLRWFGLDEPELQRALASGPRLVQWVARCADVDAGAAALRACGFDPGEVLQAERRTPHGVLRWRITVRADGRRLGDGAVPTLIEWGAVQPSESLPPSGVTLTDVTLGAAGAALSDALGDAVAVDSAAAAPLRIALATPRGILTLDAWRSETRDETRNSR